MVPVVQLVRASDCGSESRGFEPHRAPNKKEGADYKLRPLFVFVNQAFTANKRHSPVNKEVKINIVRVATSSI